MIIEKSCQFVTSFPDLYVTTKNVKLILGDGRRHTS